MFATAIGRIHSAPATIWRLASIILACSLFVVAAAQNLESFPPQQSTTDRRMQFPGQLGDKPQRQRGILRPMPISPSLQKIRSATALATQGTAAQLFLDPSEPQYSTGIYPNSVAAADFNRDGKTDLAVACCQQYGDGAVSVLLGNGDGTFQAHVEYQTGPVPVSVVVGDFNGDSKPDLAVADSAGNSVSVLLGNGDGTFQAHLDYSIGCPRSIALGDFNGDGKPDLAVARCGDGSLSVLLGNGDGKFQEYVDYLLGTYPYSVVVGDFNGDSRLDLVVGATASDYAGSVSVLLGIGDGTFRTPLNYTVGSEPMPVSLGDFNGDGKLDLVVGAGSDYAGSLSVLLGKGDGTFQAYAAYSAGGPPYSVAVGDFNGDSKADLVVANYGQNTVGVLLGNGNGTFQAYVDYLVGRYPISVAVEDFNGDGKPDLAVANQSSASVSVLLGIGNGTFQDPRPHFATGKDPGSLAAEDLNGDGKPDLAVANQSSASVSVLLGNGDGSFQPHVDYATGERPYSVAVGDFNSDSKPDLAVSNYFDHTVSVLLGNGDGTFRTHVDYSTGGDNAHTLVVGDFNGDGKPDLAVTNSAEMTIYYEEPSWVSVLLGNGDGTFQAHVDYPISAVVGAWGVTVGDFNADSRLDLAVINGGEWAGTFHSSVGVLLGNGEGTFQPYVEYETGGLPTSVAVGDFNGDRKLDLVVSNQSLWCDHCGRYDASVSVLPGNGDGTFGTPLHYALSSDAGAPAVADFNGEGKPDLAMVSGNEISVLLGKGDGTFEANKNYAVGQALTVRVADFNGDGAADLAFTTPGNAVSILLNIWRDFGVSAAPGSATLRAGSSAVFTLTANAMNGFEGPVFLSCSVSPAPELAPSCTLNPTSVTPTASGKVTAQLSVATTGSTVSRVRPIFPRDSSSPLFVLGVPICGLAVMGTGITCRRKKKTMILGLFLTLLLAGLWTACGGGSSSTPVYRQTPPGQYTVTVHATSGSVVHSTAVTITVQ